MMGTLILSLSYSKVSFSLAMSRSEVSFLTRRPSRFSSRRLKTLPRSLRKRLAKLSGVSLNHRKVLVAHSTNSERLRRLPLPQPLALSAFSKSRMVMCLPASYSSSQPFESASMLVKMALWMRVKAFLRPVVDSVTEPASTRV
ncbi:hypothetical protein D3C72_1814710 [compost metagenome]